MKYLATPSSIFSFSFFLIHRRALRSQPIRGKVRRIGRIFPEHVERSILDPEYSFVAVRRIPWTVFAKQKFAQLSTNYIRRILPTMFAQLRTGFTLTPSLTVGSVSKSGSNTTTAVLSCLKKINGVAEVRKAQGNETKGWGTNWVNMASVMGFPLVFVLLVASSPLVFLLLVASSPVSLIVSSSRSAWLATPTATHGLLHPPPLMACYTHRHSVVVWCGAHWKVCYGPASCNGRFLSAPVWWPKCSDCIGEL